MEVNEFRQGDGTVIAKVPEIKGRIFRDDKGRNGTSIVLLANRYPEPGNPGKIRHERVVIGTELFGRFAGLMLANEKYHDYFDTEGNLVYDPLKRRKEREAKKEAQRIAAREGQEKEAKKEQREAQPPKATAEQGKDQRTGSREPKTGIAEKERTVDEIRESLLKKEELMEQQLQELAQKQQEADEKLQQLREA